MARLKKKPNFNSINVDQIFLTTVSEYYQSIADSEKLADRYETEDKSVSS